MSFMDFFRRKTQDSNSAPMVQTAPVPPPAPAKPQTLAPPEKRAPFPAEAAARSVDLNMPSLGEGIGIETIELQAELQTIPAAGVNILQVNKELEALKNQLSQKDSEALKLNKKIKELEAELENAFVKDRDKVTSLEEENTLLLEQLHLVQEELETVFLKGQDTDQQLANLKTQLADTSKNLESKDAALKEAVVTKEALAKEKNQLKFTADALQAEKTELTQDRDAKAKALNDTAAERDALRKKRDELKNQLATAHQQQASANQDLQEENELILLQLHQVQEELEHYFLENQKLQTQIDDQAKRWSRVEARYPNYLDYESFEPIEVDLESDTPSITWKLTNAIIRGEQVPELLFETTIQNGKPCISLNGMSLTPRALTDPKATQQIEDFKRIRNRDMTHMLAAASALEDYFAHQTASQTAETDVDASFWRQPLLLLAKDLRSLPSIFRYDRVQLKRELIHTDYEHLWLVLQGASYGKYQWPKFEFRIGAANIRPGQFSTLPKLEIPLIDGKTKPFDSWYEESYDDSGGKYELRFDNQRKMLDVAAFTELKKNDQALVIGLTDIIDSLLDYFEKGRVPIGRPWSDWINLANSMKSVLDTILKKTKYNSEK